MFVDPNQNINTAVEHVLIEGGALTLHDGAVITADQLAAGNSAFHRFCQSLDPNLCFIAVFVMSNADESLFYAARDVARKIGIHCQAGLEKPENMRQQWQNYLFMKKHEVAPKPEDSPADADTDVAGAADADSAPFARPKGCKSIG